MPSISQLVPAFPENLPTASLIVLDFDLLLKNDTEEVEKLHNACHQKGFFYLKNHKVNTEAAFKFGKELYDIPLAEKEKYAMGEGVNYLGYKRIGEFVVDKKGTPDSQETWNVESDYVQEILIISSPKTMPLDFPKTQGLFLMSPRKTQRSFVITSLPVKKSHPPSSISSPKN